MRKIVIMAVALTAVAALSVSTALAGTGQRPNAASPSIVDVAVALNTSSASPFKGEFDTLICLVSNNAAVLDILSQKGQYTVFAPTDDAFKAINITSGQGGNCATAAPNVTNVLAYHVANGRRDAADVTSSTQIRMLNGQRTSISASGGKYYINDAQIVATDQFASNGVIHAINKVLLPSS